MSTLFDELRATQRLIHDTREVMYSLQSTLDNGAPATQSAVDLKALIRDKQIIVKGLELYQDVLEGTVDARIRLDNREKS